ncbi:MAG: GerMN domain-containing protein [Bacillota bacterium]
MRKRGFLVSGAVLLVLCLVSGCASDAGMIQQTPQPLASDDPQHTAATLYYRDAKGYIVPVVRRLRTMEDMASEVLYAQLATAENCAVLQPLGLTPVLGRKLEFDVTVEDNVAKVDIVGRTFTPKDAAEESDMVNCIVNSLCSLQGVNGVVLSVDGKPVKKLPKGTGVAGVLMQRPVNEIYADKKAKQDVACTLYYISGQSGLLQPVTMHYSALPSLEEAVNAMIEPKKDSKLSSVFPDGCKLIDSSVKEGIAELNFSKEFSFLGEYPELESRVLVALNSVCRELAHADEMKITVEGMEYRPVLNFWPDTEAVSAFNALGEEYDAY